MTLPTQDIERQVDERLKKLARNVRMPGFRPGKVPLKLVTQTYGPQVRSEVLGEAVALLGRNTAIGTCLAALLFGALVNGTSVRNLDPAVFEPQLAQNLTTIIQGLVVLIVSADVIVLTMLRRGRSMFRRRPPAAPAPAAEVEASS